MSRLQSVERERQPLTRSQPDETFSLPEARLVPARHGTEGLPGDLRETPHGRLRSVRTHYAEDHCHGSIGGGSALLTPAPRDLSVLALDPSLANIDFSRALYIDTETTGLAGGSGTIPFLIGMAWFEGRALRVEQLLLRAPRPRGAHARAAWPSGCASASA